MSTAGKALAVTVVAIAATAVWRAARSPEAPSPSSAGGAVPARQAQPGGDLGNAAPQSAQPNDSIEQQVARLTDRRDGIRADRAVSGSGGDQSGGLDSLRARRRASAGRRSAARPGTTSGATESDDPEDPDEAAQDARELSSLKQKALTDPDPEERIDAIGSLIQFDDADVIPVLRTALGDHDSEVRIAALDKLGELNEPPVDVIAAGMKDSSAEVRERTITILSGIDDEGAQALIRAAKNDPDEDVRNTAELYAEDPDLVDSDSEGDEQ